MSRCILDLARQSSSISCMKAVQRRNSFISHRHFTASAKTGNVEKPSMRQLRIAALNASVPMIGFGFMDNLVMIQAGDAIDATLGATFGLATLTSCAFGQLCSDSCGVLFGQSVDRLVAKMGLPQHGCTTEQMRLPVFKNVSMLGSVLGVLLGCLLGMTSLLFMDLDKKERDKRHRQLMSIFNTVLNTGDDLLGCDRGCLFLVDKQKQELWSVAATNGEELRFPLTKGIIGRVARSKQVENVADAYDDDDFNPEADKITGGTKTRSVLTGPVLGADGSIVGVVQFNNKNSGAFTENDVRLMKMLCIHVSEFIATVGLDDD